VLALPRLSCDAFDFGDVVVNTTATQIYCSPTTTGGRRRVCRQSHRFPQVTTGVHRSRRRVSKSIAAQQSMVVRISSAPTARDYSATP